MAGSRIEIGQINCIRVIGYSIVAYGECSANAIITRMELRSVDNINSKEKMDQRMSHSDVSTVKYISLFTRPAW